MPSSLPARTVSTLLGTLWVTAAAAGLAHGQADRPATPLCTIHPDRGFLDDAYALSEDGSALFYVNTDGAGWATLRVAGLPPREGAARPTPAAAPTAARGAPFAVAAGTNQELIKDLPLSTLKMYVLPEDRLLVVSRDAEHSGVVSGKLYGLRERAALPTPAGLASVSDITIGSASGTPTIVAITRPSDRTNEYRLQAYNSSTLKPTAQKVYKLREGEPRVATDKGTAMPLYFLDDYLTLVAKHDGFYDKKKDVRQPDFVAYLDALTGKLKRSRTITDPAALLELMRLRANHGESVLVAHDPEQQRYELIAALERGLPDGPAESRAPLPLPRPAGIYDPATLQYQLARRGLLLLSLTVDPVNEQAVAARRTDPDTIDLCAVDLGAQAPAAQRVRTVLGNQRPSSWTVTASGRLALLRKHKGFARGGTELEVHDLDLPAAAAATVH
jgi:hypothetical protein